MMTSVKIQQCATSAIDFSKGEKTMPAMTLAGHKITISHLLCLSRLVATRYGATYFLNSACT